MRLLAWGALISLALYASTANAVVPNSRVPNSRIQCFVQELRKHPLLQEKVRKRDLRQVVKEAMRLFGGEGHHWADRGRLREEKMQELDFSFPDVLQNLRWKKDQIQKNMEILRRNLNTRKWIRPTDVQELQRLQNVALTMIDRIEKAGKCTYYDHIWLGSFYEVLDYFAARQSNRNDFEEIRHPPQEFQRKIIEEVASFFPYRIFVYTEQSFDVPRLNDVGASGVHPLGELPAGQIIKVDRTRFRSFDLSDHDRSHAINVEGQHPHLKPEAREQPQPWLARWRGKPLDPKTRAAELKSLTGTDLLYRRFIQFAESQPSPDTSRVLHVLWFMSDHEATIDDPSLSQNRKNFITRINTPAGQNALRNGVKRRMGGFFDTETDAALQRTSQEKIDELIQLFAKFMRENSDL